MVMRTQLRDDNGGIAKKIRFGIACEKRYASIAWYASENRVGEEVGYVGYVKSLSLS